MKHPNETDSQGSSTAAAPGAMGFSPWQRLKSKRISYLTIPLLVMATVTEFVILSTGWKYQQVVCLPKGMGVTFFGIGPIGATILAVELLKLPLAVWTASRKGWAKGVMLIMGLPLICLLTFQLVKDMAVYEMGVALTPASQYLEQATDQEGKITQLNDELAGIEAKKADCDRQHADLVAKQAKAKAELADSLKRNDDSRQDAVSLTDYQKKELADVEAREATIIQQATADADQLNKSIADLRARREVEVARASKWNAEEARIDNNYKTKLSDYQNKKAAYEKDKDAFESANVIKRQFMKVPVDPGVAPVREVNTILKPVELADLDAQIQSKETELTAVDNKRRERVAQVDGEAHQMREEFDRRSGTRREETDRKREELLATQAAQAKDWAAQEKQIDEQYEAAVQKVDGIQAQIDTARKAAEGFYEAREASIKNTQVHRIATTVEIVRGLIMGQRPVSIKATAKERGDLYTDQISMVRIWVYPVLAFIVAFLPTLMVEIGFSTLFEPEPKKRRQFRLGFLGRGLHWLYTRAGRQKILRAERHAREAATELRATREELTAAKASAEKTLAEKAAGALVAQEVAATAAAGYEEQLQEQDEKWGAKFAALTDLLNKALSEKDDLRNFQEAEIERQVQLRESTWSDRLSQMRQELDAQHAANEAERTATFQEHHKKLQEVTEECRAQVVQARRQASDAELATEEVAARLDYDLKEALNARDAAKLQVQLQAESFALQLKQTQSEATRELDKTIRNEKHRAELQQLEFAKTLRQRNEELEHQLKQREQELALEFDTRIAKEQAEAAEVARRREDEFERLLDARVREVEGRWNHQVEEQEEAAQIRLKQREQQLQSHAESRLADVQKQSSQEFRRRESELERQLEAQTRETDLRLKQELQQQGLDLQTKLKQREQELIARAATREAELLNQRAADLQTREEELERQFEALSREADTRAKHESQQKELEFQAKLKQREQELTTKAVIRETELQNQWAADLRVRQEEWERQTESRVRAAETTLGQQMQEKEELSQSKARQREQQWQAKLELVRTELQSEKEQIVRRREEEAEVAQRTLRDQEAQFRKEIQWRDEAAQAKAKQREQELVTQYTTQAEASLKTARQVWEKEATKKTDEALSPYIAMLDRAESERDEAKQSAAVALSQLHDLEKKLSDATSFLTTWKNGKTLVPSGR